VEPFPIPHDAARPVGFVLHGEGLRVGIATDLGHATTLVTERLRGCHVLMLEFNHDDRMLREGPYPWHLKQRVSSRLGHLSNREAAALLAETADDACGAVVLAHLSKKNNTPALARETASTALADRGCRRIEMRVASAKSPTPAVCL
jgi:phosphoribosyl 1,2-cyclic phosphodiesterase